MTELHHELGYDRITPQVLFGILESARLVTVLFGTVSLLDTPEEGRTNTNSHKTLSVRAGGYGLNTANCRWVLLFVFSEYCHCD